MHRYLAAATFCAALVVTIGVSRVPGQGKDSKKDPAKSNDGFVTNWGKPKGYETGKVSAYWIWYDDGVWHFRTTGGKSEHHFIGTIEVIGGELINMKGKKGEYGGKNVDRYVFNRNTIAFDFKTDEGEDGLNFKVDGAAKGLKFTLALDGEKAPKHIHVGKDSDHPPEAIFTVPAKPENQPAPNTPPKGKGK